MLLQQGSKERKARIHPEFHALRTNRGGGFLHLIRGLKGWHLWPTLNRLTLQLLPHTPSRIRALIIPGPILTELFQRQCRCPPAKKKKDAQSTAFITLRVWCAGLGHVDLDTTSWSLCRIAAVESFA